jgi:hypothetical protein
MYSNLSVVIEEVSADASEICERAESSGSYVLKVKPSNKFDVTTVVFSERGFL